MKSHAVNRGLLAACLAAFAVTRTVAQTVPPAPPLPPLPQPATPAAGRPVLITTNPASRSTLHAPRSTLHSQLATLPPSTPPGLPVPKVMPGMIARPGQTGDTFIGPMPPPMRVIPQPVMPTPSTPPEALVFDALMKEYTAKPGETSASFTFYLTNTANVEVQINNVHTSCGCTVARLPEQPWKVAPGKGGPIGVTLDLRNKRGVLTKSVMVQSTSGVKNLIVRATIPDAKTGFVDSTTGGMLDPDRVKNIQISLADRQALFKKPDCAECHSDKAKGKMGQELYDVVCAICHDTPHRATMVTNFKERHPYTADIWRQWITTGKTNTLMSAFAMTEGGPLTHEQINSLVDYALKAFPPGVQPSLPPTAQAIAMPVAQPPRPVVMAQPAAPPVVRPVIRPSPAPMPTPLPTAPTKPQPAPVPISDYPFPK